MTKHSRPESHDAPETLADSSATAKPAAWADLGLARLQGQAQRQFEQTLREGELLLHRALLEAQRNYGSRLQEAQRDLEGLVLGAYQNYLSALTDASAATAANERGADAYEEFVRSTTELSSQGAFGKAVQDAYEALASSVTAAAAPQGGGLVDSAESYRRFGDTLTEAWKQAQGHHDRAAQAYAACVAAWKEGAEQRQHDIGAAYQAYVDNLKEAYIRSDVEGRAASAAKDYAATAEEAWKRAQAAYSDAVIALVNAGKSIAEGLHAPTPT